VNHASIAKSDRLQRVLRVLQEGRPFTTMEIIQYAGVCAVNSIISELRANGIRVRCDRLRQGVYSYQLEG
jgi:hypothetical protein